MCFNHAPGRDADRARAAARAAGGKARGQQQQQQAPAAAIEEPEWAALYTASDCEEALAHIARETIAGRMSPRVAAAATTPLRLLLERAVDEHTVRDYEDDNDEAEDCDA